MWVKAKTGTKCPVPGSRGGKYIMDDGAVEVPATTPYRRLVRDGSLIEVAAPAPAAKKKEGGKS